MKCEKLTFSVMSLHDDGCVISGVSKMIFGVCGHEVGGVGGPSGWLNVVTPTQSILA